MQEERAGQTHTQKRCPSTRTHARSIYNIHIHILGDGVCVCVCVWSIREWNHSTRNSAIKYIQIISVNLIFTVHKVPQEKRQQWSYVVQFLPQLTVDNDLPTNNRTTAQRVLTCSSCRPGLCVQTSALTGNTYRSQFGDRSGSVLRPSASAITGRHYPVSSLANYLCILFTLCWPSASY